MFHDSDEKYTLTVNQKHITSSNLLKLIKSHFFTISKDSNKILSETIPTKTLLFPNIRIIPDLQLYRSLYLNAFSFRNIFYSKNIKVNK